jgi:peptidoglycan/LPS O-acetylase OafA/YrhL
VSAPIRIADRTYYPHVEGLRGVAALYVFVFHIWQTAIQHPATGTLTAWLAATTPLLQYGHFAVAAFIVISGYCLALPVAQRAGVPFDAKRFFVRRAWRLMPAYVPVVLLSAIPFSAVAVLSGAQMNFPHVGLAIVLHLALIHNLFFATTEYLNGPLWSIALECQIYAVFALLLIPVWRRFGLAAQLGVALVLGFVPHFVFQHVVDRAFDWTVPWLLALFAMGVVAAGICARPTLPKLPWNALAAAAAVLAIAVLVPFRDGVTADFWLWPGDLALGAAIALFFIAAHRDARIVPARLLAMRPVVFLGTFSYSLYLIHAPLVDLAGVLLKRAHAGTLESVLAWALIVPVVGALAYGFYRVFERPFMTPSFRRAMERRLRPDAGDSPPEAAPELVVRHAS